MSKKAKVIIADDNKQMCELLEEILQDAGHEVESVYDGYQLLSYLEENNPSIVILDLMMPEKTGISVIDSIKQLAPYARIIIYTGYQEYENSVYARTADKFLVKGGEISELLSAVDELA